MTTLLETIATGDATRIAVLGLVRGAGKLTTLLHLARGLQERGLGVGIVAAGREDDDIEMVQPPRQIRVALRSGTVLATTAAALGRATAKLETIERTGAETAQGTVLIVRVMEDGEAELIGPGAASSLRQVVDAVARHADGRVLIEGSFNRRSFAAPGIANGIVLAVGAVMAPEVERIVAGTRYYLDLFSLRGTDERAAEVFPISESEGAAILLGDDDQVVGGIPWRARGNAELILTGQHPPFRRLVVPRSVGDDFVVPLVRERVQFEIIVRDPMRIALSPVYFSAWQKVGGGISVVHRTRVLALTLNPTNPAGPDQDPEEFLEAFRSGITEVPSHDVVLEEAAGQPKKRWFNLGGLVSQ